METRGFNAIPRVVAYGALSLFALYTGIKLAAGPGRDIAFDELQWTPAAVAGVLAITAALAALFGRACYVTIRREVAKPKDGTLQLPGARLTMFGEIFLTLVGFALLFVATYMLVRIPEALLAGASETYGRYHSASAMPLILIGGFFGFLGFLLMILRRYVWELRPGQRARRYWSRAFGRAHVLTKAPELYWDVFYVGDGNYRVPVARWLRAKDPTSPGFFRDADIALVPLETAPEQLAAILGQWQARFDAIASARPAPAISMALPARAA